MILDPSNVRPMWIGILGPVEAAVAGRRVALPGRTGLVLAALTVDFGRTVTIDRLVDVIWGEDPPETARRQVQDIVGRLRRVFREAGLDEDFVSTERVGYRLLPETCRSDAVEFGELVALARRTEDPAVAAKTLREAVDLWRGNALAGMAEGSIGASARLLDERRLTAWEECLSLELGIGGTDALEQVAGLVARHPLRESAAMLLMSGLSAAGRRAEALETYERLRTGLAEELGVDPGAEVRDLHREILKGAKGPVTPAQLPLGLAAFSGRTAELRALNDRTGPVAVVSGTGGVGKTALAVHWARSVADRFPDGQLYADLAGFGPQPAPRDPFEVVRGFLEALGIAADRIPKEPEARTGLYRSLLVGRRMLILLDNARDAGQVRPLLPGDPGCLTVVTGRDRLTGLVTEEGAHAVALGLLPAEDARALLAARLGPHRVSAEPDAVAEIADRCGGLPLGLALVAARAATNPGLSLADIAAGLSSVQDGLDGFGPEADDVRAVLSWSHRLLGTETARLFRALGVHPGPDLTVAAAAAMLDVSTSEARAQVAELLKANLLTEHTAGRYSAHDLSRAYAAELADGRSADVRRRMLDHYLESAAAALATEHPEAWFAAEASVLRNAALEACRHGFAGHAWRLARALHRHTGGWRFPEQADLFVACAEATAAVGDTEGEAYARRELGRAFMWLGRFEEADEHYARAVALLTADGEYGLLAETHLNIAALRDRCGDQAEALRHARLGLDFARRAGDRPAEAAALNSIGWYHGELGDQDKALAFGHESLAAMRELGDPGEADVCDSIGRAHHRRGEYEEACRWHRRSMELCDELGWRLPSAEVRMNLGDSLAAVGDEEAARAVWEEAAAILVTFDEIGAGMLADVRARLVALKGQGPA